VTRAAVFSRLCHLTRPVTCRYSTANARAQMECRIYQFSGASCRLNKGKLSKVSYFLWQLTAVAAKNNTIFGGVFLPLKITYDLMALTKTVEDNYGCQKNNMF
jgi:hypothetical protein